jgi:hypothetical protein
MKTDQELSDVAVLWLILFFGALFASTLVFHSPLTADWIWCLGCGFLALWAVAGIISKLWRYLKERRR